MLEAAKGFRRLKAYKQLPRLRAALAEHAKKHAPAATQATAVAAKPRQHSLMNQQRRRVEFQQRAGQSHLTG
jgi:hypothetical protein